MTQSAVRTSEPQRLRALERANEIRLARAAIKRRIAVGEVSAADVILECPDAADSWPLGVVGSTHGRSAVDRHTLAGRACGRPRGAPDGAPSRGLGGATTVGT